MFPAMGGPTSANFQLKKSKVRITIAQCSGGVCNAYLGVDSCILRSNDNGPKSSLIMKISIYKLDNYGHIHIWHLAQFAHQQTLTTT